MKDQTPKYNFKSYESLITDETTLPNQAMITESSYDPMLTDFSHKKKPNQLMKNNSKKSVKSNTSNFNSLYNVSFDKTAKGFEKMLKVIKHANSFHSNAVTARQFEKASIKNNVKTLSTCVNLNRIESTTMTALSKGYIKEQDILTYKSNIIKQDSYYLKNKVPFLQDEVNYMKKAIASNKSETKLIQNDILELQRNMLKANDDIKKINKMNSDSFTSKDSINNTLEMLKNHNQRLRDLIKNQNNKTGELVHSTNVLAKRMTKHIQGIESNRKVHERSLY